MDKFRYQKLQTKIKRGQGLLITGKSDLFYLTGFRQEGYWGLLTADKFFLLFPPLLYGQARSFLEKPQEEGRATGKKGKFIFLHGRSLFFLLNRVARKENLGTILFDPDKTSFLLTKKLEKLKNLRFCPSEDIVTVFREIKDPEEIDRIRQSGQLALRGYTYARKIIRPGMTEKELANETEYYLKKEGAEAMSFETIIAGGTNSTYPHHFTSDYVFRENDAVLLDFGVVYRGYCSDLTRVIFLGKINKLYQRVYQVVEEARKKAITAIKPGVKTKALFSLAFEVIRKAGYARDFLHSLGHGIGIDIHEKPYLSAKDKEILKPGMVFTIEPGIYIPKEFGIRIEDMVLVTERGCEVLTRT